MDLCLPPPTEGQDVSSEQVSCHSDNYTANKSLDSSLVEVEQRSSHSELTNNVKEILLDAQHNASYRETLDYLWL